MKLNNVWVSFFTLYLLISLASPIYAKSLPKCFFLSSYHPGYDWNAGIERGLEKVLGGRCEVKKFYMDTKRNPDVEFGRSIALKAKAAIEQFKPDILIAADDNASRYLVVPHYKNASLPVVFCGINWTVAEYGYPFTNATGMVEVTPARQVIEVLEQVVNWPRRGLFISGDNYSDRKDLKGFKIEFQRRRIMLDGRFVSSMEEWKRANLEGQEYDFIILHNNTNISGWDHREAVELQSKFKGKFTLTLNRWMMPFTMFGVFKIPDEQGEWAAEAALAILAGTKVSDIPITPNRRWDMMANEALLERSGIEVPLMLLHESAKYLCQTDNLCPEALP